MSSYRLISLNVPDVPPGPLPDDVRVNLDNLYRLSTTTFEPVHQLPNAYPFLKNLLTTTDSTAIGKVLETIAAIAAREPKFRHMHSAPDVLGTVLAIFNAISGIHSTDEQAMLGSLRSLHDFGCTEHYPIGKFLCNEDFNRLEELIMSDDGLDNHNNKKEASPLTRDVCTLFIELLSSEDERVVEVVLHILKGFASKSYACGDLLLELNCLSQFSQILERNNDRLTDTMSWCLVKFCSFTDRDPFQRWISQRDECVTARIFCALQVLLSDSWSNVVNSACDMIAAMGSQLSRVPNEFLVNLGIFRNLSTLVNDSHHHATRSALLAFDALVTNGQACPVDILHDDGILLIEQILTEMSSSTGEQSENISTRKFAALLRAIANAVTLVDDVHKLKTTRLMDSLAKVLAGPYHTVVLQNAATAVYNIACIVGSETEGELSETLTEYVLATFIGTIRRHEDDNLIQTALRTLSSFVHFAKSHDDKAKLRTQLDSLGLTEALENYQWHANGEISDLAVGLVDCFYRGECRPPAGPFGVDFTPAQIIQVN